MGKDTSGYGLWRIVRGESRVGLGARAAGRRPRRRWGSPSGAAVAGVLTALLLIVPANRSAAQLSTISFPDTLVGSSATVKCPTTSVALCFGANCSASGTVLSLSGPTGPFSIAKFNLLTNSQFFGGSCEANPVGLPVTVGPGQILAYEATFTPTTAGASAGSATFSTSGGPATVSLTGTGIAPRTDKGALIPQVNSDSYVPGSFLVMNYRTRRGTLQGPVDLYFVAVLPSGPPLFMRADGAFVTDYVPFQTNVAVVDGTTALGSFPFPVAAPFGTYMLVMLMVYPGQDVTSPLNWASPVATATFSYAPLSPAQQAIIQSRGGNPDLLAVTWVDEQVQKRETWIYLSGVPTVYQFLSGRLQSQFAASGSGAGPKVDPSLFTPQLTLQQLEGAFGSPTSVGPLPNAPDLQAVTYAFGLTVVFRNGVFSSASTSIP